ncbi:MAG: hypothetical protein J6K84_00720 [Oscillospiraceae bacterium]|nr:hypothetical protein [Oscillospiraceae bacterium]
MEILRSEELACGEDFRAVAERILQRGKKDSFLVPAPGARFLGDKSVEELLSLCVFLRQNKKPWERCFEAVAERFREIAHHSGTFFPVERELSALKEKLHRGEDITPYGAKLSALILKDLITKQ